METCDWGEGVLPYLGYLGTCCWTKYVFLAWLSNGHWKVVNQHQIIFWTRMLLLSVNCFPTQQYCSKHVLTEYCRSHWLFRLHTCSFFCPTQGRFTLYKYFFLNKVRISKPLQHTQVYKQTWVKYPRHVTYYQCLQSLSLIINPK